MADLIHVNHKTLIYKILTRMNPLHKLSLNLKRLLKISKLLKKTSIDSDKMTRRFTIATKKNHEHSEILKKLKYNIIYAPK